MDLPPCNFRPILPIRHVKERPNVYRSNTLDDGTDISCLWLKEANHIVSYVDLREKREFHRDSKLDQHFTPISATKKPVGVSTKGISMPENVHLGSLYHIRFITFVYYLNVMAWRLSWSQILRIIVLWIRHLFHGDFEYQRYGGFCYVNQLGVGGFYCIFLEDCQSVFKTIFDLMIEKHNFPMLISCTLGKDRTGIVSAILMQLVGYSDEEIVEQYSLSEKLLASMRSEIHEFFAHRGVGEEFEGSPPKAMEHMLKFLKEKYGGAEGYLLRCGLSQEDIDKVKRNIQHQTKD